MITNQRYHKPGFLSRVLFTALNGHRVESFAGKVIGPALHFLPEDRDDLPELVQVEWLNTTCTLYNRAAMPSPPFDSLFSGYSLMEDLALSLRVGKTWHLANARTARIFHDSQNSPHKSNARQIAAMELVNRYYIMAQVMDRTGPSALLRLLVWETFQLLSAAFQPHRRSTLGQLVRGKLDALNQLASHKLSSANLSLSSAKSSPDR
jgi:hypothetical protein